MDPHFRSFLGLITLIFISWLFSNNKRGVDYRTVFGGLALQLLLALIILKTQLGKTFFDHIKLAISAIIQFSDHGAEFVFGKEMLHVKKGGAFEASVFAFKVLPTIIFVSSLSSLLFYFGIIQKVIKSLSWVMRKAMRISGTEGLVTAANIFCGQTEAPLFVRPYLKGMTSSEINTMMTGGMATVAGGVLAAYVALGIDAGYLLAASLMSAPAAIVVSKIIVPEKKELLSKLGGTTELYLEKESNAFEAACSGASEGLKLCLNVGAMLIAFISLMALLNEILSVFGGFFGYESLTFQGIIGRIIQPIAYLIGVTWEESFILGELLGQKLVINEFLSYIDLSKNESLSPRATTLATFALCGFANFSSIAIQIGGIGSLAPERKKDFAKFGFRAMIGGAISTMMTACIAGMLIG